MTDSIRKGKELMNGYTGVKFEAIRLDEEAPHGFDALFPLFKKCADFVSKHGMVPQNAGNFSMWFADGMAITASEANLGVLEKEEVVYVPYCSVEEMKVKYVGTRKPSSETLLHYLILQCRSDAKVVVHVHNIPSSETLVGKVQETTTEEPYGSLALAKITCDTLGKDDGPIVMKNHGYLAVGT